MYVRHRSRMVRESVLDDLRTTLDANNWTGATPLALVDEYPIILIDYFPEDAIYQGESIAPNTLAVDPGKPSDLLEYELGGMLSQEYSFTFAFFSADDATAHALFQDLADRYHGLTNQGGVDLYNFNSATPTFVVEMEIELFRWVKSMDQMAPGVQLYYGELVLTDYVDQA